MQFLSVNNDKPYTKGQIGLQTEATAGVSGVTGWRHWLEPGSALHAENVCKYRSA